MPLASLGCTVDADPGPGAVTDARAVDAATDPGDLVDAVPGAAADAMPGDAMACFAATTACTADDQCCGDLSCGTTTLGQVCCGGDGASCATANGEDCCGQLLCVDGLCHEGQAIFKAPFACGQSWTYSHHDGEVRLALDFIHNDGETGGEMALASAEGTAYRFFEDGGAGNYIAIEHGAGWKTYYFHLASYLVADGEHVVGGQPIGIVGSSGASTGPHLHYEQLLDGVGQPIRINDQPLSPYPDVYGQKSLTSDNACP